MTQKLPLVYSDPNLRPDHFAKLSREMKKLFLATYPQSPRHAPDMPSPSLSDLADLVLRLATALENLTDHYVGLVQTGDCGRWDPEREQVVIEAREALAEVAP